MTRFFLMFSVQVRAPVSLTFFFCVKWWHHSSGRIKIISPEKRGGSIEITAFLAGFSALPLRCYDSLGLCWDATRAWRWLRWRKWKSKHRFSGFSDIADSTFRGRCVCKKKKNIWNAKLDDLNRSLRACVFVCWCVCACEILRNFGSVGGAALSSQAYHGDEDRMFLGCLVHHICVAPSHRWHQRFVLIAIRIIQSASKQYKESCWVVYLATSLCLPLWSCARYHLIETVTDTHIFWVICRVCVPSWKFAVWCPHFMSE